MNRDCKVFFRGRRWATISVTWFAWGSWAVCGAGEVYRPNLPGVLASQPSNAPDDGPAILKALAEANEQRGKPRTILFWNRTLHAGLREAKVTEKTIKHENESAGTEERQVDGTGGEIKLKTDKDTRTSTERTEDLKSDLGHRDGIRETASWILEDAVVRAVTAAGVRLVDRNAAIRFVGSEAIAAQEDSYLTEVAAVRGKSDLILEILITDEANAPSNFLYRITVREVGSGRLLASRTTDARPPSQPQSGNLRFGTTGLERIPVTAPTLADIAKELSKQVARTLTSAMTL